MNFFWLFMVLAVVGIVPVFVTENFWTNDFIKILVAIGVFCTAALLFWVFYVFFPYVRWGLKQKNSSKWKNFFNPPPDFCQEKYVRRLFLFDKIGLWVMFILGGGGYIGAILFHCNEKNSYQPLVCGFVYPLIILGVLFVVFFVIYWLIQFVKNFGKIIRFVRDKFVNSGKKKRNIIDVCKALSELQKIFLFVTISAVTVMTISFYDRFDDWFYKTTLSFCDRFDDWFYMFLRWLVCAAFVGGVIEKNSALFRFIFALGAILYNPIAPIHLGDRDVWCCCNLVSIVLLIVGQIIVIRRARRNGSA